MSEKRLPHAFVIAAPSGTGKTTIIRRLLGQRDDLEFSISCTTRPARNLEQEGRNYYYLSNEEFDRRLAGGEFLEWEPVHDHRYGTLRAEVDRIWEKGRYPVFDVDVKGALTLKQVLEQPHLIFIQVTDPAVYRLRLVGRKSETPEQIELRLSRLESELTLATRFHYRVDNDGPIEETIQVISELIDRILQNNN
ncbi:MAG: guanylate kinase [Candidatus Delongbacteria bacterium]|nr:guanylate kinase [Candidatus Delongbacteria bacterium]